MAYAELSAHNGSGGLSGSRMARGFLEAVRSVEEFDVDAGGEEQRPFRSAGAEEKEGKGEEQSGGFSRSLGV